MNTEKLYDILQETTRVYRKGGVIEERNTGNLHVVEIFGYPHTSEAPNNEKYEKIDMIFVDVLVDKEKAKARKKELETLLEDYPQKDRLAGGPSYIELAPNLEVEQEEALRTMALGKALGLWEIMSGKTLGLKEQETLKLAGNGFLMISGYKPGGKI
ncbi:MAG: hypothetical protein PHH54_00680 [Candidatus Nanoarchaeia archaeon]|nr:hypothetical protein [Candidatus Nanoarchaeia archaeon]MDD5740477.1 hypothetical protein [Candidatus Nanoarchaeia archaeon]